MLGTSFARRVCQSGGWQYQELGVGQTWQDLTGRRVLGVIYMNATNKPLAVSVFTYSTSTYGNFDCFVNGTLIASGMQAVISGAIANVQCLVPPGSNYYVRGTALTLLYGYWLELR